jgi:hypothetical protein
MLTAIRALSLRTCWYYPGRFDTAMAPEGRRHPGGDEVARRVVGEQVGEIDRGTTPLLFGQEMFVGIHEGDGIDRFGNPGSKVRHSSPPGEISRQSFYHETDREAKC